MDGRTDGQTNGQTDRWTDVNNALVGEQIGGWYSVLKAKI